MAFNPDEGIPVESESKFNPDEGIPADTTFNPDNGVPADVSDTIQSHSMSSDELRKFYDENPDLRDEMLRYAPGVPSVQANSENPLDTPRGATAKDALSAIWEGLTGKGSIVQTGVPMVANYAYEHPGTTGLMAVAPFVPFSWPGVGAMVAGGVGAHIADRAQAENLHPSGMPINYMEEAVDALGSGIGSGITHGAFGVLSAGASRFARPYMEALDEAARVEAQNAKNARILSNIKRDAPFNAEMEDLMQAMDLERIPEFEAKLRYRRFQDAEARRMEQWQQERYAHPLEDRLRTDRPELFYKEPEVAPYNPTEEYGKQLETKQILEGVKKMMKRNPTDFPEYQVGRVDMKGRGDYLVEPTDAEAAKYLLKLENPERYDLASKGYESLRGFPLAQRVIGFGATPGSLRAELGGRGFRIPSAVDRLSEPVSRLGNIVFQPLGNRIGGFLGDRIYDINK